MDLLDRGLVADNRIPLNDELVKAFRRHFEVVRQHDDKPSIENPFYRLSGGGFWELPPKPGAPPVYQRGNTSGTLSMRALRETPGRFERNLWILLHRGSVNELAACQKANSYQFSVRPMSRNPKTVPVPVERVVQQIQLVRGHKVLLDSDLALLYGVTTGNLNKALKRNLSRFPEDFMFRLTREEAANLRFQLGISSSGFCHDPRNGRNTGSHWSKPVAPSLYSASLTNRFEM